ncbi:myotubularin-related protein 9-like isoform X2 [Bufo gargarizans]|uniref:myotubularin-related protein 9-like isoform X2 n=1 Tax=Bufo gargarizans TaxID=30331 RepID=UPI001CF4F6D3|nr:myotubularin-related protein 9-like isoform X2 [Bufo gargarizans]
MSLRAGKGCCVTSVLALVFISCHLLLWRGHQLDHCVHNIGMLKTKESGKDGELRSSSGTVTLKCKDLRVIDLEIPDMEETFNVARSIQALSTLDTISLSYPFFFRPTRCKLGEGWPRDTMETFYHKLKAQADAWRLSHVNKNFKVCPSYPEKVIVPVSCSDYSLKRSAAFRQGRRFPVLSYYHPRSRTVLLRSAQPLVGPNQHCSGDDEMLLDAALMGNLRGFIIDIRTEQEAKQARSSGGGTENKDRYPKWSVLHRPLVRGQALQSSLMRLVGTCYDTYLGRNHWLSKLQASQWLSHIKEALSTAGLAAECIEREGTCVLIHGEEGANNTLLVTSLAQLILSPDCRTMVGFQDLIEREWLQAGHPFQLRCARSGWAQGRLQQESPNFLLFLDCCWQLTHQFPMAMEFNEKFLCTLATHAYSSEYGTFLCNHEKERNIYKVREKTHSLWGSLNSFRQRKSLTNPVYERNPLAIWPSVAPQSIQLWEGFFLRHLMPKEHKEMSWQRTWELVGEEPY